MAGGNSHPMHIHQNEAFAFEIGLEFTIVCVKYPFQLLFDNTFHVLIDEMIHQIPTQSMCKVFYFKQTLTPTDFC